MTVIGFLLGISAPVIASTDRPIVVELFTSQGCSNCPTADAILKKIAAKQGFLPLSFHVTYFDKKGWKDPYATEANNKRQVFYKRALKEESLFTPQMVIDGMHSVSGTDAGAIARAIEAARKEHGAIPITITPEKDRLDVRIGDGSTKLPPLANLYEVHFNRNTVTPVAGGENGGMTIENVNNVIAFFPIAVNPRYVVPLGSFAEDGIAYLLQDAGGKMLGAASYVK